MNKIFLLTLLVVLLVGCVSFPAEEPEANKADDIFEPVGTQATVTTETVQATATVTEQNPLAPLPEQNKTSNIAPRPKAIVPNTTNTSAPTASKGTTQNGFTTDYISIQEGETKYVYIKQPK
jgi:hypothetical protein